jgi:hypothetical protein
MATFAHWLCDLKQLAGTLLTLLVDALRYVGLCLRSSAALAAGHLFHIPSDYVVEPLSTHRKPPDVRI